MLKKGGNEMDIAKLSTAMSRQDLGLKVGVAVTKLAMDTTEQSAQMMNEMMKSMALSVQPNIGGNVDISL